MGGRHEGRAAAPARIAISVTAVGHRLGHRRYDLSDTRNGDAVILTGALGAHSVAVLSAREGLGFERAVTSDVAPLRAPMQALIKDDLLHSIRDLTRGGLIGALWDGVEATGLDWVLDDGAVLVDHDVRAATELLGLDPLALTNEGCLLLTADSADASRVVEHLARYPATCRSRVVGRTTCAHLDGWPVARVASRGESGKVVRRPVALGVPYLC